MIGCLVFLRTLDVPFFVEKEEVPVQTEETLEPVEKTLLEEGIEPPDFTLINGTGAEDEDDLEDAEPKEFFEMGSVDKDVEDGEADGEDPE